MDNTSWSVVHAFLCYIVIKVYILKFVMLHNIADDTFTACSVINTTTSM